MARRGSSGSNGIVESISGIGDTYKDDRDLGSHVDNIDYDLELQMK